MFTSSCWSASFLLLARRLVDGKLFELAKIIAKIDLILSNQKLLQTHIEDIRLNLVIHIDTSKIPQNIIMVHIIFILVKIVILVQIFKIKFFTSFKFFNPFAVNGLALLFLVMSKSTKEEAIFILFLTILYHLGEFVSNCIAYSFQQLALLSAQNRHRVFTQSIDDPFITETLISQILQISIFFEFDKQIQIILIQRICGLQRIDVHICYLHFLVVGGRCTNHGL